jgi:ferredoxin
MAPVLLQCSAEGDMADRLRANAFGRFYVTSDCDGCGECVEMAPLHFTYSPDTDYCGVYAQPQWEGEEVLMQRVMAACPRDAVRDDGDRL